MPTLTFKKINTRTRPEHLISDSRGLIYEVSHGETVKHIAIITIDKDAIRGGHYHKRATEIFFVVKGCVIGNFFDMKKKKKLYAGSGIVFSEGDKIIIPPYIKHSFKGIYDENILMEYSETALDLADKYVYNDKNVEP
jgi:dTDP-4-dehydrorhamnose 3,5-epimerase-like enzyme